MRVVSLLVVCGESCGEGCFVVSLGFHEARGSSLRCVVRVVSLFVVRCLLSVVRCSLSIVRCWLFVVRVEVRVVTSFRWFFTRCVVRVVSRFHCLSSL